MTQEDKFEAVVVGSGFGGTILALSLANTFENDNAKNNGHCPKINSIIYIENFEKP